MRWLLVPWQIWSWIRMAAGNYLPTATAARSLRRTRKPLAMPHYRMWPRKLRRRQYCSAHQFSLAACSEGVSRVPLAEDDHNVYLLAQTESRLGQLTKPTAASTVLQTACHTAPLSLVTF